MWGCAHAVAAGSMGVAGCTGLTVNPGCLRPYHDPRPSGWHLTHVSVCWLCGPPSPLRSDMSSSLTRPLIQPPPDGIGSAWANTAHC